jgi:hypothetical protein
MTHKSQKIPTNYLCEQCSYECCNVKDYNKHLTTAKHKMMTVSYTKIPKIPKKYTCNCGKVYKYRQGLCNHKKKCVTIINALVTIDTDDKRTILNILAQNRELMDMLQEQSKTVDKLTNTVNNMIPKLGSNNNITTNNNKFNLNVFLNEDCKDALNFSDFVETIKVSFDDLDNQANLGYVHGFTKLFIENLKVLETTQRPIHCTDIKRNILYIKENDTWDKEGSHESLKKGIRKVVMKSHQSLCNMKVINAEAYSDFDSEFSTKCIEIQRNLTPGYDTDKNVEKLIHNISANLIIGKT